jgi:hypothetical protein
MRGAEIMNGATFRDQPSCFLVWASFIRLRSGRANEFSLCRKPGELLLADAADAELYDLPPKPGAQQQLDQASASPKLGNDPVNRGRSIVRSHDKVLSEVAPVSCPTDDQHTVEELQQAYSIDESDHPARSEGSRKRKLFKVGCAACTG